MDTGGKKHDSVKDEIINTAFTEWGKTNFQDTSLNCLAKKLKITKPALYRYFKDKNEILDTMKDFVINKLINIINKFTDEAEANNSLEDTIYLYIKSFFEYFAKNIYHFLFYILYVTKSGYFNNEKVKTLIKKENDIFCNLIKNSKNTWLKPEDSFLLTRLAVSSGIFVLIYNCFNKKIKNKCIIWDDNEIKKLLITINSIILNGFNKNKINNIDFDKIEKESVVNPEDLPKRNKLFSAIANVVAKDGIWETTIAKIANELGMSKSSLYFHFINKDEMLFDLVKTEITKQLELIKLKTGKYERFEEKLYVLIIVYSSYYLNDDRILNVFDWLHTQITKFEDNKKFHKNKIEFTDMISSLIKLDQLGNSDFDNDFIFSYLHMQIVKEIFLSKLMNYKVNIKDMRYIYRYFLNGINKKENENA